MPRLPAKVARSPVVVLAIACLLFAPRLFAQQAPTPDSLARTIERLQRRIDSLERVTRRQEERLMELDERTAAAGGAPGRARAAADTGAGRASSTQAFYGKPFVRRFGSGTAVGGYVDLEFRHNLFDRV